MLFQCRLPMMALSLLRFVRKSHIELIEVTVIWADPQVPYNLRLFYFWLCN